MNSGILGGKTLKNLNSFMLVETEKKAYLLFTITAFFVVLIIFQQHPNCLDLII